MIFPGLTVVVSPLISLMQDQVAQLLDSGVAAAFINSTLAPQEQSRIMQQARNGEIKLLYMAPETLLRPESWLSWMTARSTVWPLTRPTASPPGATISGLSIANCAPCAIGCPRRSAWR